MIFLKIMNDDIMLCVIIMLCAARAHKEMPAFWYYWLFLFWCAALIFILSFILFYRFYLFDYHYRFTIIDYHWLSRFIVFRLFSRFFTMAYGIMIIDDADYHYLDYKDIIILRHIYHYHIIDDADIYRRRFEVWGDRGLSMHLFIACRSMPPAKMVCRYRIMDMPSAYLFSISFSFTTKFFFLLLQREPSCRSQKVEIIFQE